ncbi:PspC domain-containing protein [Bacteroidota bacterium]
MEQNTGLYRSRNDSWIGGVAGGIAKSLNLDPIIIRILFIVFVVVWGSGVLLYVILWIAIPLEIDNPQIYSNMEENKKQTEQNVNSEPGSNPWDKPKNDGNLIAGLILIALGIIFLIIRFVPRIDFADLWPVILLAVGVALVWQGLKKGKKF